ncbi:hypothetical protein [Actinotalea sp.]
MHEQSSSISGSELQDAALRIPPAALARWASMAAQLSTTGILPSQPAA